MSDNSVLISHEVLRDFARRILEGAGVDSDVADLMSRAVVEANLRGVDSHGAQLVPYYVAQYASGAVSTRARGYVINESGCCLLYHGDNGIGYTVSATCADHAIRLAKNYGIGMAVARESNHFGAAAFWGQRIAASGLIGIVMCNASPLVPPWQGKETRVGTNPICMALPGHPDETWLLDMATTTVAMGKIYKAALSGQETIPHGWAMDKEGVPTTSTKKAIEGLLMPLGGYKGSGLAMMVEILCGILSGGAMSTELSGIKTSTRPQRVSQMFLAIDTARFIPMDVFKQRMAQLCAVIHGTPAAPGYDEVLVAGDPERRSKASRLTAGIPLAGGVWAELVKAAQQVGAAVPEV